MAVRDLVYSSYSAGVCMSGSTGAERQLLRRNRQRGGQLRVELLEVGDLGGGRILAAGHRHDHPGQPVVGARRIEGERAADIRRSSITPGQSGRPQRVSTVFRTDVWSSGMAPSATRKTVPAGISGETSTAGTRAPNRVKSKPNSPGESSGGTAPAGGGTWS